MKKLILLISYFMIESAYSQTFDFLKDFSTGNMITFSVEESAYPNFSFVSDSNYADVFNGTIRVHVDSVSTNTDSVKIYFLTILKHGIQKRFSIDSTISLTNIDSSYADYIYENLKANYRSGSHLIKGWIIPDTVYANHRCPNDTTPQYTYNNYYRYYNFPSIDTLLVKTDTLELKTTIGDCMDIIYDKIFAVNKDEGLVRLSINDFYWYEWSYYQTYIKTDVSGVDKNNVNETRRFTLSQNYPNPFNPTTIITYQIPKDGFVSVKVFDALGREVRTLVNQFQSRGKYDFTFDASALSSGVYFYQLRAGGYVSTKKMILTK